MRKRILLWGVVIISIMMGGLVIQGVWGQPSKIVLINTSSSTPTMQIDMSKAPQEYTMGDGINNKQQVLQKTAPAVNVILSSPTADHFFVSLKPFITVKGFAASATDIALILVSNNDKVICRYDNSTTFSCNVLLYNGLNNIDIYAQDVAGQYYTYRLQVLYDKSGFYKYVNITSPYSVRLLALTQNNILTYSPHLHIAGQIKNPVKTLYINNAKVPIINNSFNYDVDVSNKQTISIVITLLDGSKITQLWRVFYVPCRSQEIVYNKNIILQEGHVVHTQYRTIWYQNRLYISLTDLQSLFPVAAIFDDSISQLLIPVVRNGKTTIYNIDTSLGIDTLKHRRIVAQRIENSSDAYYTMIPSSILTGQEPFNENGKILPYIKWNEKKESIQYILFKPVIDIEFLHDICPAIIVRGGN